MRHMSFSATTDQVRNRTKTVTRRKNWAFLRPGDRLRAVDRCMGFKVGEHPKILAIIEVVDVRREPIEAVTAEEVVLEGFPGMSLPVFISLLCDLTGLPSYAEITRIEFRYVEEDADAIQ